ncbi:MAG TPA: protein-export chaperone SecB [Clostridia bacterium]|jgi:preprotein translocase subunit SecB|nr:protein-export chaperone SecB [Clostridia bacterium]
MSNTLSFLGYRVTNIKFSTNDASAKDTFQLNPNIKFEFGIKGNRCRLITTVSLKQTENNLTPFDLEVSIVGQFSISNFTQSNIPEISKDACSVLYPYVRLVVSNITTTANMPPYYLPFLNFKEMGQENSNETGQIKIRTLDTEV